MNKHSTLNLRKTGDTKMLLAGAIAAGLMLATPGVQAKQQSSSDENWGEWKAMGSAYVARRRQPPKLNGPKEERRQENVQIRLENLLKKRNKLEAEFKQLIGTTSDSSLSAKEARKLRANISKTKKQLRNLDKQILKAGQREKRLATKSGKAKNDKPALWLHTGAEGLHAITLTELASNTGKAENKLRNRAKKGRLNLTTAAQADSETATQAVSWHYDKASDSILFAAQGYDTFYSDENAYKFKLWGKKALPMAVADGPVTANFGSQAPFQDTLKFEEEPDMRFLTWPVAREPDADFWYWEILFGKYIPELNVDLNVPNPANTGLAQLRVTLRGWTDIDASNEHDVRAEINGTPVGTSIVWDALEEVVLVADFDQSILDASGNNTLTLRNNFAATGIASGQWLDQVELDYLRMPVSHNDRLWMHDVAAGTQSASGFSSADIVVIESPTGSAILRKDVRIEQDGTGGWKAVFDAAGGSDFVIAERGAAATVRTTADNTAKLRRKDNDAEYLIIAPRDLSETAEALASYRSNQFSSVKIAWLDDIYNEFGAGRADPFALGRFMQRAVKKWNTAPANVVLIGKGSVDQKDRMEYSDNFLPVLMVSTPWALAASDSRLLGHQDNAPFTIGRLPITNDTEGLAYLAKIADYESSAPGDERYESVLVADNPDNAGSFHDNTDLLTNRLLDNLGFAQVTQLYHPNTDVRTHFTDSATWNTGYISYDGHGSTEQIGDSRENFLTSADASLLTNTSYPIFTALTCAAGNDTLPGIRSLASALVLNAQGGAIASVAPTGLSLDHDAQLLGNALVDSLFGSNQSIGNALRDAKSSTSTSISEFMPRMYSVVGLPEVNAR